MPLTRSIKFIPAYDTRANNPKNGSIHGLIISFQLKGPEGVLVWDFHSGIYLSQTRKRLNDVSGGVYSSDIYSHSTKPHEDSTEGTKQCDLIGGVPCQGTSIYGQDLAEKLLAIGDEVIWTKLEQEYERLFPQKELVF